VSQVPQYGGTLDWLSFRIVGDPPSWDIRDLHVETDMYLGFVYEKLFDGDLEYGPGGTGDFNFDQTFVPDYYRRGYLAESWEQPDPLTVIINLRKGVHWHDKPPVNGREFNAGDVVHCTEWRMEKSDVDSRWADGIESVTALDDYTVEVKLTKPNANWMETYFYGYLTYIWPVELEDVDRSDPRNAIGTGPFMVDEFVSGSHVTYVKNPDYWRSINIDGEDYQLPFVDKVIWHFIEDPATQVASLRTGKLDILGNVPWEQAASLREANPELTWAGTFAGFTLHFENNQDMPPLDSKDVRHALSMAIDREAFCDAMYGGDCILRNYPYSPSYGDDLYTKHEDLPEDVRMMFEYHPDEARALMEKAGYGDGVEIQLTTSNKFADHAALIAAYWADIGVQAEIGLVEDATLYDVLMARTYGHVLLSDGTPWGPSVFRWAMDPGFIWNPSWPPLDVVEDPAIKEQLEQVYEQWYSYTDRMDEATTMEEYNQVAKEMAVFWTDEMGYLIMPTGKVYAFWQPWVHNYHGGHNTGYAHTAYPVAQVWLDQGMKAEATGQ
jgi:peptide/nickel transport system substrate-binding protein